MKKWIFTLSMLGALAVGANAEPITHTKPSMVEGCYQISNAGELFGFADIVNGIPKTENPEEYNVAPQPDVCGKLVADIRVVAVETSSYKGNHVVTDDLKSVNVPEDNHWTPMMNFSGTFDGQGHTISGLYYSGNNAGFFASLTGNATIKRVSINDSYFASDDNAGGFVAVIENEGNIKIEESNFINGLVQTITNSKNAAQNANIGGFIGIINNTITSFTMDLCTNEGSINPQQSDGNTGGFIGTISSGLEGKLTLTNCYSYGFVGNKGQRGIVGNTLIDKNSTTRTNLFCYGTGDLCIAKTQCAKTDEVSICKDFLKKALVDTLKTKPFNGISFEFNEAGHIIIAHITEWNNPDIKSEVLQELSVPMSVIADSVTFDRVFSGKNSTIMLPFDIAPSNIRDKDSNMVKFNAVPTLNYDDAEGKWKATAETETGVIEAHKPYLITHTPEDSIRFHGPVTLKKMDKIKDPKTKNNKDSIQINEYSVPTNDPDWTLVGTYKTMLTTSKSDTATSDYEKESNLGRIYGFVGTNVKENEEDEDYTFSIGQFAKAGHNVRTREMRAYLIYKGSEIAPNPEPGISETPRQAPQVIAIDDLPNAISINVINKPIPTEQAPVITKVIETIKIEVPSEECYAEEECDEGTAAVAKPFISPLKSNRVERWQDAMGRRLNGKPNVPGTYFKNGIPVIIK